MGRPRDIGDSASVINILDGATAGTIVNSKAVAYGSSGEVNATTLQLSGTAISATAAEINLLDGVTATTAELNYVDGVTSNIQTQLNNISVTAGTQTKTYSAGETSTITLSGNVLSPVVAVTKEVAQSGVSNNDWDVNSSSENYTRYNSAPATTLDFDTYDVSTGSFVDSFSVASQDGNPNGLAFNDDGTKMYITGRSSDAIFQYALSTAFDVSTASYTQNFSVSSQAGNPSGLAFNANGTKMFIVDFDGDDVNEYALSTGFDISTASYTQNFSVSSKETSPQDVVFNSDGTKMFITGNSSDFVHQYALTTGFDISTASFTQSFDFGSQESAPRGLAFNLDGTKMFMVGTTGQDVNEYALTTGFDVSTASYTQNFSVSGQDTAPKSVRFNNDGTKMFILGDTNDGIYEYTLSLGKVILGSGSFASADVGKTIEANSGVFILTSTAGAITQTTAPTSYAQVASGSWEMYAVVFNTTDGDLELSGIGDAFDIANASYVTDRAISAEGTAPEDIAFNSDGSKMFIVDSQNDRVNEYALSTNYDITTESFTRSHSVSDSGNIPTGICFSDDGTIMLIAQYSGPRIAEYTLTTGFDLSNVSKTGQLDTSSLQSNPRAVQLASGGTKLYTIGDTDDEINQWNLSTANDITSATHVGVLSVSSQATSPQGLFFSNDGTKVFIINETPTNNIFQYNLSTAFLITSGSYSGISFNTASVDSNPTGIAFSADGTKMFITGNQNDKVYSYTSGSGTTAPSGYHAAHTTASTDSTYWTDINSMTADEAAGDGAIYYCVSTDDRTTWKIAKGTDGERSIVRNNSGTWQYNSNATYGSTTWANATTNAELAAIQEAMGTAVNQMNKTQLDAIPDANHFTLANDLDLAIIFNMSSGSAVPSSDGVAINYDANVLNQGAILGTDYTYDAPAQNKVRITSTNAANLKVRVV